ncbi:MAG: tetratricopeptide repeat protein [Bacteroidota bacterium]
MKKESYSMIKKHVLPFCMLFYSFLLLGSNYGKIDSLYRDVIDMTYTNLDKADSLNKSILELAQISQDKSRICEGYRIEAFILRKRGKNNEARQTLNKATELVQYVDNENLANEIKIDLVILNYRDEKYEEALDSALVLVQNSNDSYIDAKLYNTISNIYDELAKPNKAIEYSERSVQYAKKLEEKQRHTYVVCLHNLANRYYYTDALDKAIDYYKETLEIAREIDNWDYTAKAHDGIGLCQLEKGKIILAKQSFLEAKDLHTMTGDSIDLAYNLKYLGQIEEAEGNFEKALEYYESAASFLEGKGSLSDQYEIMQGLISGYRSTGQYKKASDLSQQRLNLADTLYSIEQMEAVESLEKKYENEKLQRENFQFRFIVAVVSFALLAVITGLFIVLYYHRQSKKIHTLEKRQLESEKREQKRVFDEKISRVFKEQEEKFMQAMVKQEKLNKEASHELHDDVGNKLLSIVWSMEQHAAAQKKKNSASEYLEKTTRKLNEIYEEIRGVSHKMNTNELKTAGLLYTNTETEIIETQELVGAVEELYEQISGERLEASVYTSGEVRRLDSQIEIQAYRIIQELTVNVLKHAKATQLELELNYLEDELQIMVADNGIGFKKEELTNSGIGLGHVETVVEALEGSWEVDSGKGGGTTIMVDLPTFVKQAA